MDVTLRENGVSPRVSVRDTERHEGTPGPDAACGSLFPQEKPVFRPKPRLGIKQWVYQSIADMKAIGHRILRAEREEKHGHEKGFDVDGDPLVDGKTIGKILTDRDARRFDLDWLDHLEAEFGREWMGDFLCFLCERYGFTKPVEKPDPQREAERLKSMEKTLRDVVGLAESLACEVAEYRRNQERR